MTPEQALSVLRQYLITKNMTIDEMMVLIQAWQIIANLVAAQNQKPQAEKPKEQDGRNT